MRCRGQQYKFPETWEELGYDYVLAVLVSRGIVTAADDREHCADDLVNTPPGQGWRVRSAG